MIESLREYSLYILIGVVLVWLGDSLGSDFLSEYLSANLLTIQIALLAINTTTTSIVMTKLRELAGNDAAVKFVSAKREIRKSIFEQIGLICLALVLLVTAGSNTLNDHWVYAGVFVEVLVVGIFVASVGILYDTAKSVFVILDYEDSEW